MPRTITKTIYTFGELIEASKRKEVKPVAVERAREWMIEGLQCFDWWDQTYEDWKQALEQIGFDNADISFSGFSSQGDGASFTCKSVDVGKLKAFMSTDIQASQVIDSEPEDFRPWLVWKAKGKSPANRQYRRIPADYVQAEIKRISHHYSHENTCTFEITGSGRHETPRVDKILNAFEKDVEHLRRDLCRAIYRDLEEDYEYMVSDEQLIESAEANDYTFDALGHRE